MSPDVKHVTCDRLQVYLNVGRRIILLLIPFAHLSRLEGNSLSHGVRGKDVDTNSCISIGAVFTLFPDTLWKLLTLLTLSNIVYDVEGSVMQHDRSLIFYTRLKKLK